MTQTINPTRLKLAAEQLQWVLNQYPENEDVQGLLRALTPLIEGAKEERIIDPINRDDVPCARNFGDGLYSSYKKPNIDEAYTKFRTELRGGLTAREVEQIARLEALRKDGWPGIEA